MEHEKLGGSALRISHEGRSAGSPGVPPSQEQVSSLIYVSGVFSSVFLVLVLYASLFVIRSLGLVILSCCLDNIHVV